MNKNNKNRRGLVFDIKAELTVLSFCINNFKEGLRICTESKIHPKIFFKVSHQTIFKLLLHFYNKKICLDITILTHELNSRGMLDLMGGEPYLQTIIKVSQEFNFSNIKWYLTYIKKLFVLRTLIKVSERTIDIAYSSLEKPLDGLILSLKKKLNEIGDFNGFNTVEHCSTVLKKIITGFNNGILDNSNTLKSGFSDLDSITGGFSRKDMIIIAARPSIGKTSLALNIVEYLINLEKKKILFFSLEMSSEHLLHRLICSSSSININLNSFYTKKQFKRLNFFIKKIKNSFFWVDDFNNLTIEDIRSKSRKLNKEGSLDLIIIDYLQLIRGSVNVSREQQVSEISRSIKGMAKELNVPVVVLSQLNRESEKEGRKPKLSDLRESGSIEQDSDLVLILNNKDSYGSKSKSPTPLVLKELVIAKNRNGPTGKLTLVFNNSLTKFENYYEYKTY
jgi:replicative DNA helicase